MKKLLILILISTLSLNLFSQKNELVGQPISTEVLNVKLYNTENDSLSINQLIEQYKGKVIYIDFWATWCSSCIQEMPYSLELAKKFDYNEVVFLYFSTDNIQADWLNKVQNFENKNHHFRIQKSDKLAIQNFFQIKSIPHIVIIDKNSNIAKPKAKYPSSSKAESELREILDNK